MDSVRDNTFISIFDNSDRARVYHPYHTATSVIWYVSMLFKFTVHNFTLCRKIYRLMDETTQLLINYNANKCANNICCI
uniref:Ovule protein n=1 Tax=Panagrellus redivivus TaxID=6233 RepID=A0A7E5A1V1_PANRE